MTDLHLYMLICIHNDLRDLVTLVGLFLMSYSIDGLLGGRRR